MSYPSLYALHNAILTNSSRIVKSYLEHGASVNGNHAPLLPLATSIFGTWTVQGQFEVDDDVTAAVTNPTIGHMSALHLAIINCSRHYIYGDEESIEILKLLLNKGSNVTSTTSSIMIALGLEGCRQLAPVPDGMTPLELAVYIKRSTSLQHEAEMLTKIADILLDYASKKSLPTMPLTAPVSTSVIATWKKLLFSQDFSDVKFVCPDKVELHAHRNVLAAASDYFHAYFSGPWGEAHPDGTWETTNSSDTMKAVLTFIYTGELPAETVDSNASDLLCIAHEYNLPQLLNVCESSCIRKLSCQNIKEMLLLAHLHNSKMLQKACFDFVKENAAEALTQPDIITLATEHPDLWTKLSKAITPDKKRKRT